MTAALEGGEWSAARPGRNLPPVKEPVPILQEAGWAPGPAWKKKYKHTHTHTHTHTHIYIYIYIYIYILTEICNVQLLGFSEHDT